MGPVHLMKKILQFSNAMPLKRKVSFASRPMPLKALQCMRKSISSVAKITVHSEL